MEAELELHDTAPVLFGEQPEDWPAEIRDEGSREERDGAAGPVPDTGAVIADLVDEQSRDGAAGAAEKSCPVLARTRKCWSPWMWAYLSALRKAQGFITIACRAQKVSPPSVRRARELHPSFDAACNEVCEAATERIEAGLVVSATVGDPRPIYQGGELVGWERRKSEKAAELVLRARNPAKWRPDGTAQVAIGISMPPAQAIMDAMARLTNETAPVETAQAIEDKPVAEYQ